MFDFITLMIVDGCIFFQRIYKKYYIFTILFSGSFSDAPYIQIRDLHMHSDTRQYTQENQRATPCEDCRHLRENKRINRDKTAGGQMLKQ